MNREKLCMFILDKKGNGKKTELLKYSKESIIFSRVWLMLGFLCVLIFLNKTPACYKKLFLIRTTLKCIINFSVTKISFRFNSLCKSKCVYKSLKNHFQEKGLKYNSCYYNTIRPKLRKMSHYWDSWWVGRSPTGIINWI